MPLSISDIVFAWLEQDRTIILQQLELLESGKCGTHENDQGAVVDTTARSITELKARLGALEELIASVKRQRDEA